MICYLINQHGCKYCFNCALELVIETEMKVKIVCEDSPIEEISCCICGESLKGDNQ